MLYSIFISIYKRASAAQLTPYICRFCALSIMSVQGAVREGPCSGGREMNWQPMGRLVTHTFQALNVISPAHGPVIKVHDGFDGLGPS